MVVDTPESALAAVPGGPDDAHGTPGRLAGATNEELRAECERLRAENARLAARVRQSEQRRHAMIHIMDDLNSLNRKLGDQRKAMLHILADYEQDRKRLAQQTLRLDNSRRALLHILQDMHQSNSRLENSRKAMIHIMSDLTETTAQVQRREQELREKQEQLVQAGKLATLGELTTGVAHELNNPLNNIGIFIGNVIDRIEFSSGDRDAALRELRSALQQVHKATQIITHLRTFGRAAPVSHEPVDVPRVIEQSFSLMNEQLRLRQIEVELDIPDGPMLVEANAIQLEQVFINLIANARDALANAAVKRMVVTCETRGETVVVRVSDTGPGIPPGMEQRIFDPFFTTKDVGEGTGLGLSITYGILKDHNGSIAVESVPGKGATFIVELPLGTGSEATKDIFL